MNVRPEFTVHTLNESGKAKANNIALHFSQLLDVIESSGVTGRQLALVKTHLETACFNAKRGIAELIANQE